MLAARKKSVISPKNYDKLSYCADFFVLFCIVSIFGSYTTKKIMFFFGCVYTDCTTESKFH